jgi:hypothetical protein
MESSPILHMPDSQEEELNDIVIHECMNKFNEVFKVDNTLKQED